MKPMLASDWDEGKVRFPCIAQPKIDGVRALNMTGRLTGRSLKEHKNRFVTQFYSHPELIGFDGEMAAEHECNPALCRLTTSALNTITGEPFTLWWVFDYLRDQAGQLPYYERLMWANRQLQAVALARPDIAVRMRVVKSVVCENLQELEAADAANLALGYEGTCIRDPQGKHKAGRSTVREGGLLRIKRFHEEDAFVLKLVEGQTNTNEGKINELGHTERSTHQENMVPNGMVGAMLCRDFKTNQHITVGAGCMTHAERLHYWAHPGQLVGQTIKYKAFAHGRKDLPRFPTFQSIRSDADKD